MNQSRQATFITGLIENGPTIIFFLALYTLEDVRVAGWWACPAAVLVCAGYLWRKLWPNAIMVGINLYFIAAVAVGETMLLLGFRDLAILLAENALFLVLAATFVVGSVLTFASKRGFVGHAFATRAATIRASIQLLGVNLAGVFWAALIEADRMIEVGVPLLALFGAQRFLIARELDAQQGPKAGCMLVAGAPTESVTEPVATL